MSRKKEKYYIVKFKLFPNRNLNNKAEPTGDLIGIACEEILDAIGNNYYEIEMELYKSRRIPMTLPQILEFGSKYNEYFNIDFYSLTTYGLQNSSGNIHWNLVAKNLNRDQTWSSQLTPKGGV